jgi:predicted RNA binding protein YcfA (HicA-like mRNA interferase family)
MEFVVEWSPHASGSDCRAVFDRSDTATRNLKPYQQFINEQSMSRREKLLDKMRKTPGKIRLSEVEALLGFEGFDVVNRRGSHDTYQRTDGRVLVIVRPHGGRTTLHPRDIRRILEALDQ